jgi:hypothetical protein
MADAPPTFDTVKAAFYLVALVLVAHVVVVLVGVAACVWHAESIVAGNYQCDASGHLFELLGSALSAALAFAGGMMRGPPPSGPQ